jgi:chromosome segregation ATPase
MQELKASSQLFTDKFVGDVNKSFNKFIAAVDPVKKVFTTLADVGKPLPKTRAEFTKLLTSLDKDSSELADTLLKNVSSFDDYYAHLEASQEKINSFVTDLGQAPVKSIKELSDEFNTGFSELGMAAPKTKAELAKLASSLDLTTESGSQTFASIQKLSPKFKEMQDRLESMGIDTTSIDSLKEQVNSSFKELDMQVPIPNTIDGFKQLAASLDLSTESGLAMFSAIEQATPAMQKLGEEVGKVFSIDSSSLASSFSDAITNSTSAMEASQKVKDEFEGQILKGMMDTTLKSISSTLYDAVVSPMLSVSAQAANETINSSIYAANTNISAATTSAQLQTTGAVNASSTTVNSAMTSGQITTSSAVNAGTVIQTSGVLTGAALQQVVEHVTSQIKNMAVVMNELKKSGAMEEIKNALGDTAAVAYKEMAPLISARREEPTVQPMEESLAQQEQQRQAEERQKQEERIQEERNQQEEKSADDARSAIEEAKKRAEEARKIFTDFGVGLDVLSLGIEGNAKVMYDLKRTYNDATMAQLMTTTSSKDLIEKMKGMSQVELEAMAKSAGVELSKLTSDLSGLVEMAKASEKSMTDFRTKMEVASGAMTDNEQTLKRLSEQYPNLTKMFGEQELSSKDLAKQFSTMSDDKLLELSSKYGVSIEKFTSESETYVNALKTQEESLKTQADTLKELSGSMDSFREKMKQSVTGATDNMLTSSKVDVGVSSMTSGKSSKEMASMFAGMDDAKLTELTKKFGITFDKLKSDAELLVSTAKTTEDGLSEFRNSLGTMSGSMTENQIAIQKLSQKYPSFSEVLNNSSITLSSAVDQINSLSDDQLTSLASSLGVEFETLKSDAGQWLGILKQDDDALKESTKNIQSFQTEMKKNSSLMTESAITLSDLSQRYPALSSAINDSSITAKDAASAFMNMDMSTVAKQSNVSVDQLITDAQSWLGVLSANDEALKENEETAKANNEALLDYRQTMLKATGTYGESQLSLKKMTDTYPLLSKVIDNTSVSSKDAAKYLSNLSSSGLDTLAKDFGMSTDQFRETSSEWIGILASNEESFNSFNKEMSKLGLGLSDNQIILNGLAEKYPQLSQIIFNSGMTADQAAKSFSSMTSVDLTEMAAKFGVSMETLQTDIQSFVSSLPNKEIFSGLRDGLDELINPLSGSEKTINDLAKKYPQLNLAANALDINVSQAVDSIKSMTDESMITWANENGIAYEEAKDSTIAYLSAVKELQQQLGSFKDEMHQLATGMSDNEMTMSRLKATYPALASALDKTGISAQEVGKFFDQLSQQQIQDMATAQGVSVEAFISDVKSYVTILKDNNEKFSSFKNEISKFTNTLSENETVVKRLTEQYPSFISNMEKLGSSSKDVASNLSSMNEGKLADIANQVGMTIEEFTKNSNDYLTALAAQEEEMKNSVKSVVGMQTEFRKMTSGLSDAQYTVNSLTSKYPNLIKSMGLTGKSADDVAKKFMTMDPEKLVSMAKGLGTSTDEFVGEISNYVSALKTLGDEAKAITDSLNSFKGEMDKMGSSLTDNEYTIANITKSFPALTSELSSLGSGSKEIAQSLAGMSTGQLSAIAKQTGVSVDEFIGNSKSYIEALKTREENLKQTQEQAVQDAKETQDKVMQTIDNYFSIFNQLSDKIANLSNNLVKDISAYDTEEQKIEKRRKRMTELENSINSLNSFGLDNEKAISKTIEDMDEYRGLIIEETSQKIDLVKKEQEAAQKAHDDTINALKESLSKVQGVISSVNSDIEKLNEELKQNQSKVVARDTLKTKFTSSLTDSSKTTNEKIDLASQYRESIGSALQEQLAALDKNRDEAISNLEKERDAKLKHFEEVQDAAKKLQDSVSKLKESIASMRTSVQGDMEKLAKDMGLPGTTATEKLTALQSQIGSKMPVNEESIKKLETYKGLVMESLNEQIEKENKRFEEVKKTQDAQRDHYKKLIDFSKDLKGFVDNLKLGDTSYYNPQRRLDEAKRQYEEVLALARTGDEQAMSEVTGKAQTYLKEAQSFYASSDDYTKIFDSVNANMEGMRLTAEGEAKKIAENLPLDETETAKNVANIVPLQQAAMEQLKSVDGLLASMDTSLQNPSASPMPDEQFSRMLESERQNFDKLIEAQKQTTIDDGNKLREAAKIELQNLNNSLQGIQTSLEANSNVKFDDTVFANQITGLQQASVQQLMELGQYVIAMDAGIKDSLNQNVSALMGQLSPENQAKAAAQLDEAMQKNITGPLYELIAAVKGESVKKGNEKLEAGFKDNQTAINNAITAFSQYREMSNLTGIQLSFDDFINKISPLITNVANPSSMTGFTVNKDVAGINTLLSSLGVSQENLGRATQQVESIMSQILVEDKNQKWENTWSEFKTGYLQGNKELMAAFQSTQTDKKAVDLAKYREMSLIVSGIENSFSMMKGVAINQGRTNDEVYNSLNKTALVGMAQQKGLDIPLETYQDFKNAKASLDEIRKSLLGIVELKPGLESMAKPVIGTVASQGTTTMPQVPGSASTTVKPIQEFMKVTTPTTAAAATSSLFTGNVSSSGAKDIIVKIDEIFNWWKTDNENSFKLQSEQRKFDQDEAKKLNEDNAKSITERYTVVDDMWKLWREEELLWRNEDVARNTVNDALNQAWHGELIAALDRVNTYTPVTTEEQNKNELPSFDTGSQEIPKDMVANVHKGEIIIDPKSSNVLRNYGIKIEVSKSSSDSSQGKTDMSKVEKLLEALLQVSVENGQRISKVEESVYTLEDSVGKPIKRAVEKGNNVIKRS